jgi:NitT/TauT family transport system ATP-binding protein
LSEVPHPILELRGVSKQFELQGQHIEALRDARLSVNKGEFVCLIGASGCGKSTLLRIVAGFEQPSAGQALMWGMPIRGPGPERGMVFQDYGLFPWLTVRGNIGFGPQSRGRPAAEVKDTVERFISLVGLQRFADAYPHQLSGGMNQRVSVARAFCNDPEILLMDEPFAALDEQNKALLQEELLRIWSQTRKTVIFVTHSIDEALVLGDRVVVMSQRPGRLKAELRVDFPRPRYVYDLKAEPAFGEMSREIWTLLREEVVP